MPIILNKCMTQKTSRGTHLFFGLMHRIDLVEKVGSGIKRMRDAMKEANLIEPKFEMGDFFTVVFYRPIVLEKWLES